MKTKTLAIALLSALALGAASHAALPKGRVGATEAECQEPAGSEWSVICIFENGRATLVFYSKAAGADAPFSDTEVADLLGLNGGKREEWTGRKTGNGTKWTNTDGVLLALFDPAAKTLTVETTLHQERLHQRRRDSVLLHRQDALQVWELGVHLGILAANLLRDPEATKTSGQLGAARKKLLATGALQPAVAAEVVELPELPEMTGDGKADLQAIMKFAGTCEVAIAKALAKVEAPERKEVNLKSCFKLGFFLPSWAMFYRAGLPATKTDFTKEYSKLLQANQLPETLDAFGLGKRAASGVSAEDFEQGARDTAKQIGQHLANMVMEREDDE